jgi:hypothetical protein
VPNLLLRRRYMMGCVFFSPLDKLEQAWRTDSHEMTVDP